MQICFSQRKVTGSKCKYVHQNSCSPTYSLLRKRSPVDLPHLHTRIGDLLWRHWRTQDGKKELSFKNYIISKINWRGYTI